MLSASEALSWFKQNVPLEWVWLGCCVLFSLGIVWNIATWFESEETGASMQAASSSVPATLSKEKINLALAAPFFGVYLPDLKNASIAASSLSIEIVGIMYAEDPHQSQVVVKAEDGFDKIFRAGENLKPGLRIKAIQADGIIILNQGKLERLSLPRNALRFDTPPAPLIMKEE